jgi:hypothetical protein
LGLLLPLRTFATMVVAPEFNSLVDQADYVVRAVVVSVNSEWRDSGQHRHIITKVELDVRAVIKGTPPQPLVLEMLGGTVDGVTLRVEGAPVFNVGDENILFVHGNGHQIIPLVALSHGQFPVQHDAKSGKDYVLRSNGMPLYSEADVSLPLTQLSAYKAKNPSAQPLTAEGFIGKIHSAGPATRQPPHN